MAWLRVDDGYDTHPKLLELTELQRWRWTRVLLHCARHRTEGHVKVSVLRELGLGRTIPTLLHLELLEKNGDAGYLVHDWPIYNGATIAEKVAHYLGTHPDATANAVHRAIGGTRNIVLSEVAEQRAAAGSATGSATGSDAGTDPVRPNQESRYGNGTHAREPVPSPKEQARAVPALRPDDEEPTLDAPEDAGPPDTEQPSDYAYTETPDLLRSMP